MEDIRLSVIIPCCKDPDIQKTVDDISNKVKGLTEIIVVLDGYEQEVKHAKIIINDKRIGMRASINKGIAEAKGKYLMKCDAHCMFDQDFDEKIISLMEDNWVVVPRRYRLNTDKWEVTEDRPVDYERIDVYPHKLHGVEWVSRARQRKDKLIDEDMVFQGSCWIMSKNHWDNVVGPLQEEGYGTFTQEPVEIALKTWLSGGKVMVNKNTWYAHKHRKFGRTVGHGNHEIDAGNLYSRDFWVNNKWEKRIHDFKWLQERFGIYE